MNNRLSQPGGTAGGSDEEETRRARSSGWFVTLVRWPREVQRRDTLTI